MQLRCHAKKKKKSGEEELGQPGLSSLKTPAIMVRTEASEPDLQTAAHLNYRALGELLSRNTRGRIG